MRLPSRRHPTPRSVASLTPSAASAVGLAGRGGGDYGVAAIEPRAIAARWTSTTSTSRGSGGRAADHVADDPRGGTGPAGSARPELRHGTQHAPWIAHQPDVHRQHEPVHDRRRLEDAGWK